MTMKDEGDEVKLEIRGEGFVDSVNWKPAGDLETPSEIGVTRSGTSMVQLTPMDLAPRSDRPETLKH